MPVTYRLEPQRKLVIATCSGAISGRDVSGFFDELADKTEIDRTWRCLVDATDVESAEFTMRSIRAMIEHIGSDRLYRWRLAIAASLDLFYGLSRVYQILSSNAGSEVGVFRTVEEAERWLDQTAPE